MQTGTGKGTLTLKSEFKQGNVTITSAVVKMEIDSQAQGGTVSADIRGTIDGKPHTMYVEGSASGSTYTTIKIDGKLIDPESLA